MRNRCGHTLLELLVVLALLAIAIGLAYPATRAVADAWAVRAARDAAAALLASTRAAAIAHRGAELLVVPADGTVLLRRAGAAPEPRLRLRDEWRVRVISPAFSGDTLVVRYDALGLGRVASRTLRFERGRAVAGLTIASYGRVRRW